MMEEMEYTELKAKLDSLEAEHKEIERVLLTKRSQRKAELATEFRERLLAEGFEAEEIADALVGRRGRGKSSKRSYPQYIDNNNPNNIYVRGPLPVWMKENMASVGLDASQKSDRERYKQEYMRIQN